MTLETQVVTPAAETPQINISASGKALSHLQLLRLHFVHHLTQDTSLPPFKGAIWHGVFGLALKGVDEAAYACLFDNTARAAPWRLIAPAQAETHLAAGGTLAAEVILFNDAIAFAPACAEAIVQMGAYGFGEKRSHATLETLTGHIGEKTVTISQLFSLPDATACGIYANVIFAKLHDPRAERFELRFVTPLSLKAEGKPQRETPTVEALVARTLGRLIGLLPDLPDGFISTADRTALLAHAEAIEATQTDVEWFHWERYSGRQKSTMPFGGLVGRVQYRGTPAAIAAVLPWLTLAQWIGLGSKTTFGQGQIALAVEQIPQLI